MTAQTSLNGPTRAWRWAATLGAALALAGPAGAAQTLPSPLDRPALQTPAATDVPLVVAEALPGGDAVAAGARGVVLRAGGNAGDWRQAPVPVAVTLTAMAFRGDGTGYAVGHGGAILRTEDAGRTWTRLRDGRTAAADLRRALSRRHDPLPDWAERWLAILATEATGQPFLDVCTVPGGRTVLASGAFGQLWRSDDAGTTWTPIFDRLPVDDRYHLYDLSCTADVVVIGAEFGRVYRSTDGGGRFAAVDTGAEGTIFGTVVAPDGTLVAYGLRGLVLRSTDDGASWDALAAPVESTLVAAATTPDGGLLLLGRDGRILGAPPGWDRLSLRRTVPGGPFNDLALLADGSLLLAGRGGPVRTPLSPEAVHD
ncbi:hypothetical protein [Arhodomonas sp. SL1]|uniref:WD40/YVTN/BNR-like repeat-containing protein n=1 Tax=Arhodomonas sp. SL1 TaxID=3425691 RepID=UPI003F881059